MATTIHRATYANIGGGGSKSLASLYNNIGGSRKTISSLYGNISGTRKQIFPYSATTIYTWNRYNASIDYSSCATNIGSSTVEVLLAGGSLAIGTSYSVSSYKTFNILPSGSYTSIFSSFNFTSSLSNKYWGGSFGGDTVIHYSISTYTKYSTYAEVTSQYDLDLSGDPTDVRGTYIDQVTSSDASRYPRNGALGSYWYEFVS